jgi:hypothetical protein
MCRKGTLECGAQYFFRAPIRLGHRRLLTFFLELHR